MKNKSHLVFYAFVVIPIQMQASTTPEIPSESEVKYKEL